MPTQINLDNLASQDNFEFISTEQVETLWRQDKKGQLTLDSQGNLTAITAPPTRDGCIVRFFKGLFSKNYCEQQKQLDRLPLLEQNAAFSQHILRKLVDITHSTASLRKKEVKLHNDAREPDFLGATELANNLRGSNKLTLEGLRAATQVVAMKSTISSSVQAGFYAAQGRAVPVLLNGRPMELREFLEECVGDGKANTIGTLLHNTCQQVVMQAMKGVNMQTCKLLTSEEQKEMVSLLARPASSLKSKEQTRLNVLMTRISTNLATQLSQFANAALKSGVVSLSVASAVQNFIKKMENSQDVNEALTEMNEETSSLLNDQVPVKALSADKLINDPNPLQEAMGNDPIKVARMEMQFKALNLSQQERDVALSLQTKINAILNPDFLLDTRAKTLLSPEKSPECLSELSLFMMRSNVDETRYPQVFEAALFGEMLNGKFENQPPQQAQLIINSCDTLMKVTDSNALARTHKKYDPINILQSCATIVRDKIQPLLPTGTTGVPISRAEFEQHTAKLSAWNTRIFLRQWAMVQLESRLPKDMEAAQKADILKRTVRELYALVSASSKTFPKEAMDACVDKAITESQVSMFDLVLRMLNCVIQPPVDLEKLSENLFVMEQKIRQTVGSGQATDVEIQTILKEHLDRAVVGNMKLAYETLMEDESVGQYFAFMLSRHSISGTLLRKDNLDSLLRKDDLESVTGQAHTLQNFMVALEATLKQDKKENGQDLVPCLKRLASATNYTEIPREIPATIAKFLKKFNLKSDALLAY